MEKFYTARKIHTIHYCKCGQVTEKGCKKKCGEFQRVEIYRITLRDDTKYIGTLEYKTVSTKTETIEFWYDGTGYNLEQYLDCVDWTRHKGTLEGYSTYDGE